jgi:DNA-binding NarL/FixJ family response regulator
MAIRVLLVDDQTLARVGLHAALAGAADIQIAGEAATGAEAFAAAREECPRPGTC